MTEKKSYTMDMSSGPILKKMLVFAIPLIFSGLLQLLFNAADVIVVGRFAGDDALAAVGATTSLIHLFVNLFLGLSIGANVLVARFFAAKQEQHLSETVHTSMAIALFSGVFLAIVGAIFAPFILRLMATPDSVLVLATIYLRVYFLGMPAMMVYNFGAAILRSVGDTKRPLRYLTIAGVVNVTLNLVFVIVLHWSVFGVALATTISQILSAICVFRCLMKENSGIRLEWKRIRIYKDKLGQILRIGLPAGLQSVLFSFSNVIIQSSVNSFGATVVAGNSAAANIEGFVYIAMNAFYQANISFTGQNVGAGKYHRINRVLLTALGCVTVVGVVMGAGCYGLGGILLRLYTESEEVVAAGMIRLAFIGLPYALCGIMEVLVGSLRGMGYAISPMIVSLIGTCAFRVVWLKTVFLMESFHQIETVYVIYPITWVITIVAHIITYIIAKRKLKISKK